MDVRQPDAVKLPADEPRHQEIEGAESDQCVPPECAGMHMAYCPIGEVANDIHALDRHHRAFKRSQPVKCQREDDEFHCRVGLQFFRCAGHRHDAVDHRCPRRCEQNQAHTNRQGLHPIRYGVVVQVMWSGPDIAIGERPESDNG